MPTCPMCGETKYDGGYDDGSTRVCYRCKNWGPPKDKDIEELRDEVARLREELRLKRRI